MSTPKNEADQRDEDQDRNDSCLCGNDSMVWEFLLGKRTGGDMEGL